MYALHLRSSSLWGVGGGVVPCSFCLPISAMSLVKSRHKVCVCVCVWFGCAIICVFMVCIISGMNLMSSSCDDMYIWSNNHGFSGLFLCGKFVGMVICWQGRVFL